MCGGSDKPTVLACHHPTKPPPDAKQYTKCADTPSIYVCICRPITKLKNTTSGRERVLYRLFLDNLHASIHQCFCGSPSPPSMASQICPVLTMPQDSDILRHPSFCGLPPPFNVFPYMFCLGSCLKILLFSKHMKRQRLPAYPLYPAWALHAECTSRSAKYRMCSSVQLIQNAFIRIQILNAI